MYFALNDVKWVRSTDKWRHIYHLPNCYCHISTETALNAEIHYIRWLELVRSQYVLMFLNFMW